MKAPDGNRSLPSVTNLPLGHQGILNGFRQQILPMAIYSINTQSLIRNSSKSTVFNTRSCMQTCFHNIFTSSSPSLSSNSLSLFPLSLCFSSTVFLGWMGKSNRHKGWILTKIKLAIGIDQISLSIKNAVWLFLIEFCRSRTFLLI